MSSTKFARAGTPSVTSRARGICSVLILAALAVSGCVTGQLADSEEGLGEASAGRASAGANSVGAGSAGTTNAAAGGGSTPSQSGGGGNTSTAGASPHVGGGGTDSSAGGAPASAGASNSAGAPGGAGAPTSACPSKRGVAYAFDPAGAAADMNAMKSSVSWFYGWASGPSAAARPVYAAANLEFVPMVWGGAFNVADVVKAIPAGSKYLLGFNEPNFGKEANLTPEKAAELWPQIEQIAAQKNLKIVSPATNYCAGNCNRTDPFVWLDDFFKACPTCKVDYIGVHWYACTIEALQSHIEKMKKYNKPMWLTEFACVDGGPWSSDQVKAYAVQAMTWLEQEPSVFRYSWFSGRSTISNVSLLGDSGSLTAVGSAYVNQAPKRCQ